MLRPDRRVNWYYSMSSVHRKCLLLRALCTHLTDVVFLEVKQCKETHRGCQKFSEAAVWGFDCLCPLVVLCETY